MQTMTRKAFIKLSAATAAFGLGGPVTRSWGEDASVAVTAKLSQFGYADVQLLDGPMRRQFDANHAFFLALDDDKLLKPFRQAAGQPAPGDDMGGWYSYFAGFDPHKDFRGFIPGHSFGQYVSGLARAYAVTGSPETKAKVERLVRGFAPTVTEKFYVDYHLPAYTYDKTVCGLVDAYRYAGDASALAVLDKATDAVLPHLPEKALSRPEMIARPHKDEAYCWDESYTLPENQFLAYRLGAGERYKQLAIRFLQDDTYFNPLAEGKNVLPGEHAYSHVNALSSALQAYLVLGSRKHFRAAQNGFEFVKAQSFATGGWGRNEGFIKPGSGELGESLTSTHSSFETPCGSYGHFKIARYLLRVTGDSRYGDSMEQVLYNTILGAKPLLENGSAFYYSDYNNDAHKFYHNDKWPCCSGTFPQITADYGISSYFRDARGIYVNLYVPSRVSWEQGGARVSLAQRTDYPYTAQTTLQIASDRAESFAVDLRIPAWAGPKTRIAVNGRRTQVQLVPGRFASLRREWRNGDRIEIEFDMPLRLQAVDAQHPNLIALVHGPLVLFALNDPPDRITRASLLAARQVSNGSADWTAKAGAGTLRLKPFADIRDEHYRLYNRVVT